jgi:hypothetical protein
MVDDEQYLIKMAELIQSYDKINEEIEVISNQWVWFKHEHRRTRDGMSKVMIQKKWDKLDKKLTILEKRRRKIISKLSLNP